MHDPDVVAFQIRRPWPRRSKSWDAKPGQPRWRLRGAFWTLAGRGWHFPTVVTIWHREPGGHDSGEVCKQYRRIRLDGRYDTKILHGWKLHLHHWRIQVGPLQDLRRWLLTRCAWCGGPSRKGDAVSTSHSWDGPRGRWWQGEPGLYHADCSAISTAHAACTCDTPVLGSRDHGRCGRCARLRAWRVTPTRLATQRILSAIPHGQRDPDAYRRVCDMVAAEREEART